MACTKKYHLGDVHDQIFRFRRLPVARRMYSTKTPRGKLLKSAKTHTQYIADGLLKIRIERAPRLARVFIGFWGRTNKKFGK